MKPSPADLAALRPYLVKFALLQVGERNTAEDLVQEALLAGLRGSENFSGRSSVRTWLTAILLHKIADYRRRAGRETSLEAQEETLGADTVDAMFQANGAYVSMPRDWRNPEEALTDKRFLEALEACLTHLKEPARQVFLLRELMGLSIEEICKELGLSPTNCSVVLHRCRLKLRSCLEDGFFDARDYESGKP